MKALDERPLPDKGLGIDAGNRILRKACAGATVAEIDAEIRMARSALGPWREDEEALADSEVGILAFFRQLDRYYDGRNWLPPLPSRPKRPTRAHPKPGPQSVEEARSHLITKLRLNKLLEVGGKRWLDEVKLPKPARKAPKQGGFHSRYGLGDLYDAYAAASRQPLPGLTLSKALLGFLEHPRTTMPWQKGKKSSGRKAPESS